MTFAYSNLRKVSHEIGSNPIRPLRNNDEGGGNVNDSTDILKLSR